MKKFKSEFLNKLSERELLHQISSPESLDVHLTVPRTAYLGIDCTASSLHMGNLIQVLILKYLQESGHNIVLVMGEGTTLIGDPSGKDTSRAILHKDQIAANMNSIKLELTRFINFNHNNATVMSNADWLMKLNYLEFLRDYGPHFTINRMLSFDSVAQRLARQQPLTFLEFNYLLLQAADFLHLYKNFNVTIQVGGSDQWGNIINGVELIRKTLNSEAFAVTTPLLTKADGSKMGKTADGALWLNKDMLSSWDLYQYFRNVEDSMAIKYLKMLTTYPIKEIEKLSTLQGKELNEVKKILAFEIIKFCHSPEDAIKCRDMEINLFEKNIIDNNLPTINILHKDFENGLNIVNLLSNHGLCSSNGEAKKLISNSGVKINDTIINTINYVLTKADIKDDLIKVSVGKKKHVLLKIT